MAGQQLKLDKPWWGPIVHAFVHTLVGSVIFVIIALAAVLLGLLVKWLETLGVRPTSSAC